MSQRSYALIAGVVFLLIALGHLLRIIFGVSVVVSDNSIPMWMSIVGTVVMAFLSYEGFHSARKAPRR